MNHPTRKAIAAYASYLYSQFSRAGFTHPDVEIWLMAESILAGRLTGFRGPQIPHLHGGQK
jgi:hypothetical protein